MIVTDTTPSEFSLGIPLRAGDFFDITCRQLDGSYYVECPADALSLDEALPSDVVEPTSLPIKLTDEVAVIAGAAHRRIHPVCFAVRAYGSGESGVTSLELSVHDNSTLSRCATFPLAELDAANTFAVHLAERRGDWAFNRKLHRLALGQENFTGNGVPSLPTLGSELSPVDLAALQIMPARWAEFENQHRSILQERQTRVAEAFALVSQGSSIRVRRETESTIQISGLVAGRMIVGSIVGAAPALPLALSWSFYEAGRRPYRVSPYVIDLVEQSDVEQAQQLFDIICRP
jgi:hypothetical protein